MSHFESRISWKLLGVVVLGLVLASGQLSAQKAGEQRTKKAPAMTEPVYKKLTEAQELIENKQTQQGLAVLAQIKAMPKLTPYEKAQLYNYYAYTYFSLERYQEAIRAYEQVLAQPDLPEALETGTLYTIAQLYFTLEDYRRAVDTINIWFQRIPEPSENAYLLLGQGYYQLKEYKKSIVPIKKGMELMWGRGQVPKENLYLLLRVNYYELGDYKNMAKIVEELVKHYPKKEYWMTLAGAYSEMKQMKKQMVIMEMLYERGDLDRGNQILNLANLYLLHEVPYKAAKVLDKGIKEKKVEANVRNLRLLSQAWTQSREDKRSLEPLQQAARKSKDGELDMRLGQAYINLEEWSKGADALSNSLKKGGLRRIDQANVLLGMCLFELQKFNASAKAFRAAGNDKRSAKTAASWLKYIGSEVKRKEALDEALRPRKKQPPKEATEAASDDAKGSAEPIS